MCNLPVRHRNTCPEDVKPMSLRITSLIAFVFGTGMWLGENYPNLVFSCYTFWGAGLFLVLLSFWEFSSPVLGIIGLASLAGGMLFWQEHIAIRDLLMGVASGAFCGLCIKESLCNQYQKR